MGLLITPKTLSHTPFTPFLMLVQPCTMPVFALVIAVDTALVIFR